MNDLARGSVGCRCELPHHAPRFIVLTGGPGAGKTAALEMTRRMLCPHLAILPESASIVFGGGFPRGTAAYAREAAQRAIAHVQIELENLARRSPDIAVALCDRGTVDGLAYWPRSAESWFDAFRTTHAAELARYAAVIHLRTPPEGAYDRGNALRIESAHEAAEIDARIERAWAGHPRRFFVESTSDFATKIERAVELVRDELPPCCHRRLEPHRRAPR